jgi:NitT/TauT family transport system substrate-binding protein
VPRKIRSEIVQAVFALPWLVARDEGLFAEEDIEVEFIQGVGRDPNLPFETDPGKVDPYWRHFPFEKQDAQFYNACEWGQITRSDISENKARIVSIRPAVASQAIFVRPDSDVLVPQQLRNKTVAVNFHAGSHYLALQMLEGFMPRDEIKAVHMGEAKVRFQAMMDGRVEACALMEPYITIAEKHGANLIIEAHYRGSEMAKPDVDPETHAALNRAITKAVRLINADKRKYLHYLIDDVPPELGPITADDFRLARLRYVEPRPYPMEEFELTRAWMQSWGLAPADASWDALVDNRITVE